MWLRATIKRGGVMCMVQNGIVSWRNRCFAKKYDCYSNMGTTLILIKLHLCLQDEVLNFMTLIVGRGI